VNPNNGKCELCGDLYEGCSKCNSDICYECKISTWTLTDYGCIDLSEYITSVSSQSSSKPLLHNSTDSASKNETGSSVGIIVGIVIGLIVVAAIVAIVVFFVKNKRGTLGCSPSFTKKGDNDHNNVAFGDEDSYEMEVV